MKEYQTSRLSLKACARICKKTNKVLFESEYSDRDILKNAGCQWDVKEKTWYLPFPIYSSLRELEEKGLVFFNELKKIYLDMHYKEDLSLKVQRAGYDDLPVLDVGIKLYLHQNKTLHLGKVRDSYADLSDCGTGKTISTLAVINDHLKNNLKFTTLVICPKSIILSGWVEDCNKAFPNMSIQPVIGSFNKKIEQFSTESNIYVTNYETLNQDFDFLSAGIDMIVFDEAVRLKNPYAKWTKKAMKIVNHVKHRVIISGLITPNNLMEVFAPFSIVEPGILGKSFYQFRDKYFTPNPWSYMNKEFVPKKKSIEQITKKIERLVIRHKKSDCLDLPEKIHTCKYIPMEKEQRKVYDVMLKDMIVELQDEMVTAVTKGVVLQKLSQITSGFLYKKDSEAFYFKFATAKLKELKNLLEGELIDEQVIIFCTYKGEISLFREHFPQSSFIYGGQSSDEQEREIRDFKNGDKKLLFANIKAGKYGLTFTNCSYVIYYSLSYSLDDMYQSEERIHRIGQEKTCNYIYLMADKSTDKRIYNSIRKKQGLNDMVYKLIEDYNEGE